VIAILDVSALITFLLLGQRGARESISSPH